MTPLREAMAVSMLKLLKKLYQKVSSPNGSTSKTSIHNNSTQDFKPSSIFSKRSFLFVLPLIYNKLSNNHLDTSLDTGTPLYGLQAGALV